MEITSCLRFSEAVEAVQANQFDVIFLDHDLGDLVSDPDMEYGMYSSRALNGADFADWLARHFSDIEDKPDVIIISVNPAGVTRMMPALKDFVCTRSPFPSCLNLEFR